jgi:hypothetical protein
MQAVSYLCAGSADLDPQVKADSIAAVVSVCPVGAC